MRSASSVTRGGMAVKQQDKKFIPYVVKIIILNYFVNGGFIVLELIKGFFSHSCRHVHIKFDVNFPQWWLFGIKFSCWVATVIDYSVV